MALGVPSLLVLAPPVHEEQNGIALLAGVIAGRRVHVAAPPPGGDRRVIPTLAHLSMRHVPGQVVVHFGRFRNLDAAVIPATAEEGPGSRIGHVGSVHREGVVVEPHHEGCGGDAPHSVLTFHHVGILAHTELNFLRLGREKTECSPAVRIHAGVLRTGNI